MLWYRLALSLIVNVPVEWTRTYICTLNLATHRAIMYMHIIARAGQDFLNLSFTAQEIVWEILPIPVLDSY